MKTFTKRRRRRKSKLRVWLDDERPMPTGFDIHVRLATEAIRLIADGEVALISLDHDLGSEEKATRWSDMFSRWLATGCGNDVAKFIEEGAYKGSIRKLKWRIHSANPVGVKNMTAALENADKYWYNRGKETGEDDSNQSE